MKKKNISFILLFICILLVFSAFCYTTMYSTTTIEQTIFHTKVPITGVNTQVFLILLLRVLPPSIITFILFIILTHNYKNINNHLTIIKNYIKQINIILLLLAIFIIGYNLKIITYLTNVFTKTDIYEKYYKDPNTTNITFKEKRNLIYIYIESLENIFIDKTNGGNQDINLINELTDIAKNNINFSNTNNIGGSYQLNNTNWTSSALISSTSGIPLSLLLTDKNYSKDDTFFPNVNTLGDILKSNGYNNVFLLGSDANFGGRKSYFKNHGYEVKDINYYKDNNILDKNYHVWWGFEDTKLFDFAKEELKDLSSKKEPFNLTLLTTDTHFVDGYLESNCDKKYNNKFSNVLSCSSKQINDFVNWIKTQDFYNNTTIILTGDHLYMDTYYIKSKNYDRTIYNSFINTFKSPVNTKNRTFTTLDLFPTTLSSIGANIENNRLSLGTDLFSETKTIPEEIGFEKFNNEISKQSNLYNKLLNK